MTAVAQISFFRDPRDRTPERLLDDWPTLAIVAEAASQGGARTTVIQASAHTRRLSRGGIDYHFLPCDRDPAALRALLARLQPQVLHVQGLGFPREVIRLAGLVPGPNCRILLQDHADGPPRRPWRWPLWRRGLSAAHGLMFCAREQAVPFRRRGLVRPGLRIYEVPESSSRFGPRDADEARRATGLHGDPCLLWVGNLIPRKDPLTVLDGVAQVVAQLPGLQLWCCYVQTPLLHEIRARIASDPRLAGRVHLLGPVPHARVEVLMAAADVLVQGSRSEGSGYSVIEAMACGLPPVVTDIPSFRVMTGDGACGRLWPPGRSDALARGLLSLCAEPPAQRRAAARASFEAWNSFEALGRCLAAAYDDVRSI
jgi:glycosyltransferase involved in cell wall biosynthesis